MHFPLSIVLLASLLVLPQPVMMFWSKSRGLQGGRNAHFAPIYHWDMAFEGAYPVSRATQQYQMEPVGTELSNTNLGEDSALFIYPWNQTGLFWLRELEANYLVHRSRVRPPPKGCNTHRDSSCRTVLRVYHIYHWACGTVKMFKWMNKKSTHMQTVEEHRDSGRSQSCFLLYTGTSHSPWSHSH